MVASARGAMLATFFQQGAAVYCERVVIRVCRATQVAAGCAAPSYFPPETKFGEKCFSVNFM